MRLGYLDAFSGISGDMLVGALADAGADAAALCAGLEALGTGARFRFERTLRGGVAATKFHVEAEATGPCRHLKDILRLIEGAELPVRVKQNATKVFDLLAAVEAAIHQVPVERVHFHEVGAVDSIADVVGACLGFELLGIEEIHCSPVNLGSGVIHADHGTLPVPAPATAALLKGKPVYSDGPAVELTTPTGAAIVAALASSFGPMPAMTLRAVGYGAGTRELSGRPNVLRLLVGEDSRAAEATLVAVLEANVDDSTPEVLAYALERLLEAGALDATLEPLYMKKGRPGLLLRVLARPEDQERLAEIVFSETSTFGLRLYRAERRVRARRTVEVEIPAGKVRIKVSEDGRFAPEYEDCRRLALASGKPLREILLEATLAYWKNR
ncbi:MAG: nickel pincer cofactor biosynthesis protein LarC [Bryobacterales bacterium]|nr:nickel pincer cofactor biosynthesis protein LarC [Bryobacteraceae bacterium]MDW8131734.1 nickel pincer cofactor biosynthesis protein LarC [Bryobacterales bacterium]